MKIHNQDIDRAPGSRLRGDSTLRAHKSTFIALPKLSRRTTPASSLSGLSWLLFHDSLIYVKWQENIRMKMSVIKNKFLL